MSRRHGSNQSSIPDSLSGDPADVMRMTAAAYRRGLVVNGTTSSHYNNGSVGVKSFQQQQQQQLKSPLSYSQTSGNSWNSEPSPRGFGSRVGLVQSQIAQSVTPIIGSQFSQAIFSPSREFIPLRDTTRTPPVSSAQTPQKTITPIRDPFRSPRTTGVTPVSTAQQPLFGSKAARSSPQSTTFNPASYARGSGPILEIMTHSSAPASTTSSSVASSVTGKTELTTPLSITAESLSTANTETGIKTYDLQRLQQRAALNQQLLLDTLVLANSVNGTSFDYNNVVFDEAKHKLIQPPLIPLSSSSSNINSHKNINSVVSPTPSRFAIRREKAMAAVNVAKVHVRGGGGGGATSSSKGNVINGKTVGYRVLRTLPFLPGPDMRPPTVPPSIAADVFSSVLAENGKGKGGQSLGGGSIGQQTPDKPHSASLFDLVSQASKGNNRPSESNGQYDQSRNLDEAFLSPMSKALAPDLPSFFSPQTETTQAEQSAVDIPSSEKFDADESVIEDKDKWVNDFDVSQQTIQQQQDQQLEQAETSSTVSTTSSGPMLNGRLSSFVPSVALYDFEGIKENDEMRFVKGDEVLISQWSHPTWWWGQAVSRSGASGASSSLASRGWFPKAYVNLLAPLPTLPPPMVSLHVQSAEKSEVEAASPVISSPSITNKTSSLVTVDESLSMTGPLPQAALYVARPPIRSTESSSSSESSFESKASSNSTSSYDSVIDSDVGMDQTIVIEPKKDVSLPTVQEPLQASVNKQVPDIPPPPSLTRIASFTEPLYSIGEDDDEDDDDNSVIQSASDTDGRASANATALYLAKTIDTVIAAGAKSSSRRSSISSLVGAQSSTFIGGAHVLDLSLIPGESRSKSSLEEDINEKEEKSSNKPPSASMTRVINEGEEAQEISQKAQSTSYLGSYSLPPDVLTLLNALHSRGLLKPQQDDKGKGQVSIDADVSELLRLVASAVASTIKREASAGDLKASAALSEQNSALETKIATIVTKLATKASFKKTSSSSILLTQQEGASPRAALIEGPQRTLSPSYHSRALSVSMSPFSSPVATETSQAAEMPESLPSLQRNNSMMAASTPLGAAPLLRAQRSFFRTPGDSGGGLEELPQVNSDSPGFGIEATIVYSPESSPSAPPSSSSAMDSLLYSEDGRRLKVSTLSGPELFYVFRKKLSGVASFMFVLQRAIKRKRLIKLAGFALMKSWARSVLAKRRAVKVYVLGLAKVAARRRLLARIASPMAILGSILLPLRERRAELVRRAEAASLGPALLAGLERGLSAAEMMASAVSKKQSSSAAQAAYTGPKMRGIHWEGLSEDNVKGTIWDTAATTRSGDLQKRDPHSSSNPSIDVQQLLPGLFQKFAVAEAPPTVAAPSRAAAAGSSTAASKLTSVLSADVGRLLAISVGSVINRRELHLVRQALLELDVESLGGADKVQLLANSTVLFDPEKMQPIREYTGDSERLVLPERFVRDVIMTVPAARIRLAVMEFMTIVPELVSSCKTKLLLLRNSVSEVKKSKRFATLLLDVILPLGNRLNAGSRGRSAAGFKISSLHKLMQTRASTGETFLQFVVAGLVERAPKLVDLQLDFPTLLQATPQALSRDRVTADIARMEQGVRQTEQLLAQQKSLSAASGPSGTTESMVETDSKLRTFYNDAISQLSSVRSLQSEATAAYEELASWLGEDPAKTTAESLLGFIQVFTQAVAKDAREVKGKLERAANAAKRQQYVDTKTTRKKTQDEQALNVNSGQESPKLTIAKNSLSNLDDELAAERNALESLLNQRKGLSSTEAQKTSLSSVPQLQTTRQVPSKSPEASPTGSPRVARDATESILFAGGAAVEAALLEGQKRRRSHRRLSPLTDLGDSLAEVAENMKVNNRQY